MKVFVYGTLIPGQRLYPGIESYVQASKPAIIKDYQLFMAASGWYPVIVRGEGEVKGYMLEVEDEAISLLDSIEGAPYLYTREKTTTEDGDEVFTYVGAAATPETPIPDGDFVRFLHESS